MQFYRNSISASESFPKSSDNGARVANRIVLRLLKMLWRDKTSNSKHSLVANSGKPVLFNSLAACKLLLAFSSSLCCSGVISLTLLVECCEKNHYCADEIAHQWQMHS